MSQVYLVIWCLHIFYYKQPKKDHQQKDAAHYYQWTIVAEMCFGLVTIGYGICIYACTALLGSSALPQQDQTHSETFCHHQVLKLNSIIMLLQYI